MVGNILQIWILFLFFENVFGFGHLRTRLPNGFKVPHPCPPANARASARIWNAVGHGEPYHVTRKNAFGEMMKRNGLNWTKQVCEEDADMDGVKNGAELGDPECKWTPTNGWPLQEPTGHPGICEPHREYCYYGYVYEGCRPNADMRVFRGDRPRPPVRTPPPHFGKHPQALLTERLSKQPGRFGSSRRRPSFTDPGFQLGVNDQQSSFGGFSPAQTQISSGFDQGFGTQGFGESQASSGSLGISDPSFPGSFDASGQFDLSGPSRSRPRSRSFDLRAGSTTSPAFDWSDPSGSFQSSPSRGFSGQFRGAEPAVSGSRFWQSSQAIPRRSMEPSRDSFATSLNQRFIQGGSSGFGRRPFTSPAGGGVLQRSVQRRIQQARDSHSHRPATSRFMDWRSASMGTMEPQYPQFRGTGGSGSRFMF